MCDLLLWVILCTSVNIKWLKHSILLFISDSRSHTGRRLSRTESQTVRQVRSAIKKGDIANLQNLLVDPELCIDSSFGGVTALHLAASLDSEEMCQLLLSAGACPEGSADDDGNSLLHQMVKQGKLNMIRMLIKAGADIESSNVHGSTPINSAAELGLHEVVKELIDADCGVNRPNLRGRSPLSSAAMNGHLEVVKQLISAECDIHWKDHERKNALMVAIEAEQLDVAKFLITAGRVLHLFGGKQYNTAFILYLNFEQKLAETDF